MFNKLPAPVTSGTLLLCLLFMVTGCGTLETADRATGTGGETIQLSGTVEKTSGTAVVTLYPRSYNPRLDGSIPDSLIDTTDENGAFSIKNIRPGKYNVEASGEMAGLNALLQNVDVPDVVDTAITIGHIELAAPGSVALALTDDIVRENGYLYIPGTSVYTELSKTELLNGSVVLSGIPAGLFPELVYGYGSDTLVNLLAGDMQVQPESTVVLEPFHNWNYKQRIYIHTDAAGAGVDKDLYFFPLLVRLDGSNFDFSRADSAGRDIRFTKADGQLLSCEIERWDVTLQLAELWVQLDTVFGNNSTQYFIMHWGKTAAVSVSKGGGVFDTAAGFTGVWHLQENSINTAGLYSDATFNNDRGQGTVQKEAVTGAVGPGMVFDGTVDYIDLDESKGLDNVSAFTVSFWCNADSLTFSAQNGILSRGTDALSASPYIYGVQGDDRIRIYFSTADSIGDGELFSSSLSQGRWHYLSFSWDGSIVRSFLDGVAGEADTTFGGRLSVSDGNNWLGAMPGGGKWDGKLDEIRVENVSRSAEWLKMCYETQKAGTKVLEFKSSQK
ncbi:MAG: DUF2341 domain-containing protein [Fibrobacteria bacterium]|nr:DUF2341 domain-containing protein [Fibrobacteria bacterium]